MATAGRIWPFPSWPGRRMPPGPRQPYRRAAPAFFDVLAEARSHAELSSFRVGSERIYFVTRPDHVMRVLAESADVYSKAGHRASRLLGQGLVSSTGELWARQRRLLHPQFTSAGIRPYVDRMASAAERRADEWDSAGAIDLALEMRLYALDTIWRAIFSEPLAPSVEHLLDAIDHAVGSVPTEAQFLGRTRPPPAEADLLYGEAIRDLDKLVYATMRRHEGNSDRSADDLLSVLRRGPRSGPPVDLKQIRDELVTALIAGHETTARALAWTFHLLKCHPAWESELLAEMAAETSQPSAHPSSLPKTTAFVSEVLRMYPPVWVYPRRTTADSDLGGWHIPAGSHVVLSPYFTHRHPEFWKAPEEFRPERFLDGDPRAKGSYFPFGLGERACIGKQFTLAEMKVLLATLLPRFQLHGLPGSPAKTIFLSTLRPDLPARIRVSRRDLP